jgi:hypothetical protein
MPWDNASPSHMRAERDAEQMRRSWESWYYGRTGLRSNWEQDTHGSVREVYVDKRQQHSTGCALIVFRPFGVWFDTHHEWDEYPFDCLMQTEPNGPFVEVHQTGKWLRHYTSLHKIPRQLKEQAAIFLQTSNHPWCQQHRQVEQRHRLGRQQSLAPETE